MILVTGATGHYGTQAIKHLLKKGVAAASIVGLVRAQTENQWLSQQGVLSKFGDYTNYESLVKAFEGIDKLLLVSSNDKEIDNRTTQHLNVIKAAQNAGVKQIVYTSFVRKTPFEDSVIAPFLASHVKTEQTIKESGMAYTILQNGIYQEMIPLFAGEKVAETGIIMLPAEKGKASWVLREELAEAAAYTLTTEGHENKTYPLTNIKAVGFDDIAKEITHILGRHIAYQSPSTEEFSAMLRKFGIPDLYIGMFTMWGTALAEGMMDVEDTSLASLLGRKPTTVQQFITQVYS